MQKDKSEVSDNKSGWLGHLYNVASGVCRSGFGIARTVAGVFSVASACAKVISLENLHEDPLSEIQNGLSKTLNGLSDTFVTGPSLMFKGAQPA